MGYEDLGTDRSLRIPILNETRDHYFAGVSSGYRAGYSSYLERHRQIQEITPEPNRDPEDYDTWLMRYHRTPTPAWPYNHVRGYIEVFRDGHRLKASLFAPLSDRAKPSTYHPVVDRGRIAEADIRTNDEAGVRLALDELIQQCRKRLGKSRHVDINDRLLRFVNLSQFFSGE